MIESGLKFKFVFFPVKFVCLSYFSYRCVPVCISQRLTSGILYPLPSNWISSIWLSGWSMSSRNPCLDSQTCSEVIDVSHGAQFYMYARGPNSGTQTHVPRPSYFFGNNRALYFTKYFALRHHFSHPNNTMRYVL